MPEFRQRLGLIVPDEHWPYVDRSAWDLTLRVGRHIGAEFLVVLGDLFDFYQVSCHDKSPSRAGRLVDDLGQAMRALDDLEELRAESCYFIEGNHEARLNRYVERVAPALHGLPGLTAKEILRLEARGWHHTPYGEELAIGSQLFSHDYGSAGEPALRRAVGITDSDTVIGHTHRIGEFVTTSRRTGQTIRGMSFGWGGDVGSIDYFNRQAARHEWGHGCGVAWTRPDGTMRLEAVRFIDGKAKVDGQCI